MASANRPYVQLGPIGTNWHVSGPFLDQSECNVFTLLLRFSQFTKELEPDIYQWCSLNDRSECYSKRYSCLANYGHTHACDDYYTKMYILNHLIK